MQDIRFAPMPTTPVPVVLLLQLGVPVVSCPVVPREEQ